MGSSTECVRRHRRVDAWSGTFDQLRRTLLIVDKHARTHFDQLSKRPEAKEHYFTGQPRSEVIARMGTSGELWLLEKATGDITNRRGDVATIFEDINDRQVIAAKIDLDQDSELSDLGWGHLAFAREGAPDGMQPGAVLKLEQSPPDWSAQVADAVSRELGECLPFWHSLRTRYGRWLTIATMVLALFGATFLILQPVVGPVRWAISAAVGLAGFSLASGRLFDLFLPSFEVRSGSTGTGTRNLGILGGSVFLALLVGVVVNRIS